MQKSKENDLFKRTKSCWKEKIKKKIQWNIINARA